MLPDVTGLHQVSQNPSTGATVFAWDALAEADTYAISVDGRGVATVASPSVTVVAAPGAHVLGVAPLAAPTPATRLGFTVPQQTGHRDPLLVPFASTSYPNMPIGSDAVRVAANLIPSTIASVHADVSVILMDPSQPLTEILPNGGFSSDRCVATSQTPVATVPMAPSFVVPNASHNYSTAAVGSDGTTYVQGGSFGRCVAAKPATLGHTVAGGSLSGDALSPAGGRGGSGMDALAGTIRVGELRPGSAPISHAIAIDLDDLDNATNTFVWPATKKDSYAYHGSNPHTVPGALLALPLDFAIASLSTEPGRMLAQAIHDHGAYNGNDTKGPGIGLCTEWSGAGNVVDDFLSDWGYSFAGNASSNAWVRDVIAIFSAVDVIVNNGPNAIGGGGTPIVPLIPPLAA